MLGLIFGLVCGSGLCFWGFGVSLVAMAHWFLWCWLLLCWCFLAIGCCVACFGVFVQLLRGVLFVSLGCGGCNVLVGCVSVRR